VERINAAEARSRWGAQSSPLLIYLDESGRRRYAGGFTDGRGRRARFIETTLIDGLLRGLPVPAQPAYGCAIASRPWNWKLLEE
jgi:hypothetical protein